VSQKIPKHENHDISEMRKYFCSKFCSFIYKTTVQKYDEYVNFRNEVCNYRLRTVTVQKADFIIKVIECPTSPLF